MSLHEASHPASDRAPLAPGPSRRDRANAAARERLARAALPAAVLVHALGRRTVPDLPHRAVASYWRAHALRADRLARGLAARSEPPENWRWVPGGPGTTPSAKALRMPPAPFRDGAHPAPPGTCCVCGQPVYRLGWHRDLWADGVPNRRARWHAACVAAWSVWTAPGRQSRALAKLQKRRCALTGERLLADHEVDHRVALHVVRRTHGAVSWPGVLRFWGFPNLGAINRAAHRRKSAAEAALRARPSGGTDARARSAAHERPVA